MARKPLPPHLAADLEKDAREGARLTRIFRQIDRAYPVPPHEDYSPEWYAANRACWKHSLGTMVDKYGLFEHWTTYITAMKRYLDD